MPHLAQHDDWSSEATDDLRALKTQLEVGHRRAATKQLVKAGSVCALALLLVAACFWLQDDEGMAGGISCAECLAHFDEYQAHLVDHQDIDGTTARQMHDHLVGCEKCRVHFENLYPGVLEVAALSGGITVAAATILLAAFRSR